MAKNMSLRIRIGASYDEVTVQHAGRTATFDRAEMRKDGRKNDVRQLTTDVVALFADEFGNPKDKRRMRRETNAKYAANRRAKRDYAIAAE